MLPTILAVQRDGHRCIGRAQLKGYLLHALGAKDSQDVLQEKQNVRWVPSSALLAAGAQRLQSSTAPAGRMRPQTLQSSPACTTVQSSTSYRSKKLAARLSIMQAERAELMVRSTSCGQGVARAEGRLGVVGTCAVGCRRKQRLPNYALLCISSAVAQQGSPSKWLPRRTLCPAHPCRQCLQHELRANLAESQQSMAEYAKLAVDQRKQHSASGLLRLDQAKVLSHR